MMSSQPRGLTIFGGGRPLNEELPPIPTGSFDDVPHHDPHDISLSGLLSIIFSTISVICVLSTLYWFCRMRRRFRHDLIMLLIFTNGAKAFWQLLFPVAEYFYYGLFPSEHPFCQATGFFMALFIETADLSCALIALHSLLSVFTRGPPHGQGGLYPYRKYAYAVVVIVPIILASVAFANKHGGYTAQGAICYLPTRPIWFLALSWVPRYIVVVFILTTYTVIYLYVEAKSFSYHRAMSGAPQIPYLRRVAARIFRFPRPRRRSSLQQGQDLLSRQQRRDAERDRSHGRSYRRGHRQFYQHYPHLDSALTLEARQVKPLHPTLPGGGFDFPAHELEVLSSPSGQHPTLPGGGFNFPAHELQQLSATGETSAPKPEEHLVPVSSSGAGSGSGSAASLAPAAPVEAHDFARENAEPPPNETAEQQRHEYLANLGVPSVPEPAATAASAYRRDSVASVASSISSISSATSLTDTINDVPKASHDSIMAQHHRMKRQLRYMFVYPAVYIISWIPTFVSHIVKTNPSYYNDPSYALSAVIIIFSCSQATMDCVLFSIIEKPWRHIPGSSGTFFGSFNCLAIRRRRKRGDRDDPADVRERLARDLAYAARLDNAAPLDSSERPRQRRRISGRGRRYWWEVYEDDPSLSRAGRESVRRKRARADEVAEGRRRDSSELARKKVRRRSSFGDMEAEIGEASGHGTDSGSPQGDERHESGSDQSESSDGNRREERDTG